MERVIFVLIWKNETPEVICTRRGEHWQIDCEFETVEKEWPEREYPYSPYKEYKHAYPHPEIAVTIGDAWVMQYYFAQAEVSFEQPKRYQRIMVREM